MKDAARAFTGCVNYVEAWLVRLILFDRPSCRRAIAYTAIRGEGGVRSRKVKVPGREIAAAAEQEPARRFVHRNGEAEAVFLHTPSSRRIDPPFAGCHGTVRLSLGHLQRSPAFGTSKPSYRFRASGRVDADPKRFPCKGCRSARRGRRGRLDHGKGGKDHGEGATIGYGRQSMR